MGKTNSEIVKLLKAAKSTVYYTVTRFQKLKSAEDCDHGSSTLRTILKTVIFRKTPKVVDAVRARVWHNPKRFMMGMAYDMNVSDKMVRNTVKTDLKLSSLKMQTCQHLTDLQKEKRLDQVKILLNKLKACTDTNEIIFSDEKLITVKAICNRQND